jgi:ATP-dependent Clp protease protease subunit
MASQPPAKWLFLGFNWLIDPFSISKLTDYLGRAQFERSPGVTIILNSVGGSPEQALYAASVIEAFPIEIHTHNVSTVQSAAGLLFLAGHKRYASPEATFMFHPTVYNAAGSMTPTQMALQQSAIAHADDVNIRILAQKSGRTTDEVAPLVVGDRLHNAQFAKQFGFVDEVAPLNIPADATFIQIQLDMPKR